jgi:hypothetical protein
MFPRPGDTQCTKPPYDTHAPNIEFEQKIYYSAGQVALVRGACQEVHATKSRRSGPRRWRRAVEWLIAAGLHPRANATTQRVAHDLADRMDYDTGHVRYAQHDTAARLGLSLRQLQRHIAYLRELGALVWVEHGTRANIRRTLGLGGYAGTATVYGAVTPPVYDHAMGHQVVGEGYEARIIVDQRPRIPAQTTPVDNSGADGGRVTPSLTLVREEGKLKVEGGEKSNYTPQAARSSQSPTQSSKKNRSSGRRSPLQVAKDVTVARQVRPLVNWTQTEGLRRLAFALRPLIDRGLDAYGIAEYLHGMHPGGNWRPRNPAAYISTALEAQQKHADLQAAAAERFELENPAAGAFTAPVGVRLDLMAALRQGEAAYEATCRARGWDNLNHTPDAASSESGAEADILAFLNGSPA